MVMLVLHICFVCDIINTHLFESYPKTDKIQKLAHDDAAGPPPCHRIHHASANKYDPICEMGRIFY